MRIHDHLPSTPRLADAARLLTGADVRRAARSGGFTAPTAGCAPGYLQANLVILPISAAADFRRFCEANPKACPLVSISEPGARMMPRLGADLDLATDVPRYCVWRDGALAEERTEVAALWRDDLVCFALGCSFSFEEALLQEGLPVRHVELGCNVPMFRTSVACTPAGPFAGPLIVSMRPFSPRDAVRAAAITRMFPCAHGAPVHIGDPGHLGIATLDRPDFGDPVPLRPGEIPVFWACGVTPQAALETARLPLAITHAPGHMLVTDFLNSAASGQLSVT
jgi:uncharacterized protein YcsI (UPF0317 family)